MKLFRLSGGILNDGKFEAEVNSWLKKQDQGTEIVFRDAVTLESDLYLIIFYK